MKPKFEILYHPDVVKRDIRKLSFEVKGRVRKAIESKLTTAPDTFGVPLRRSLKGYWKLQAGDYRVIFKMKGDQVIILRIGHRREVYEH